GAGEARDAGAAVDRTFAVGAFDRITVSGPYDVTVKTGGQAGVSARGGDAILAETEVVVEDGELKIRTKSRRGIRWTWGKDNQVKILVTAPAIRAATIAGSGGIDIDRVAGGDFNGQVAGSGDLSLGTIDATNAEFGIAGSGGIRAAGKVDTLEVDIAGSGDVDLSALTATDASVSIAGSGNVRTRATGTAKVSMMGSGNVEVTGGAKCAVSKHGSGDVRCS
ncbi:MAG: DUF2807 domain-containing protein, partial [Pseudomonadota bacterium]|nr:DUF2807 domain-containing protein [Pseudomonadota bacterium]